MSAFIASAINYVTLKDCAGRGKGLSWNSTQLANTRNENQGRTGCITFPDLPYYELMHPLMHETSFVIGRDAEEIRNIRLDTLS